MTGSRAAKIKSSLKITVLAGLVAVSFAPVDSPSGSVAWTLEQLQKGEPAVIAIANSPPQMMLAADGTPTGAGPEIDRAVLRELGVTKLSAQVMSYGAMIPAIQARRVTLASGDGLVIKPARCASTLFSNPVACSGESFVLPRAAAGTVHVYRDLADRGLRVGVCGGCTQQKYALDAGVRPENITVYSDEVNGLKMLLQGRFDVMAADTATATSLQKRSPQASLITVQRIPGMPLACVAAAFNDAKLRDAYNVGLKRIMDSGEYLGILKRFDLEDSAEDIGGVTTAQLCK